MRLKVNSVNSNEYPEGLTIQGLLDYHNVEAVPLYVKADSTGKTAQVIFQAKYVSGSSTPKFNAVIFSDVITVHLVEPQPEPEPEVEPVPEEPTKKGCKGSLVGVGSLFLSTTSLFGVLMFMKKRRKD